MSKTTTSIRLDAHLHKEVQREAKKAGLTFSGVVNLLLVAFTKGSVQVGVTQYPKQYLDTLGKELKEMRELKKKGALKTYTSSKEMFDDILQR